MGTRFATITAFHAGKVPINECNERLRPSGRGCRAEKRARSVRLASRRRARVAQPHRDGADDAEPGRGGQRARSGPEGTFLHRAGALSKLGIAYLQAVEVDAPGVAPADAPAARF